MPNRIRSALVDAQDTESVELRRGAIAEIADVFTDTFGDQAAVIVGDARTMTLAGDAISRHLTQAGITVTSAQVFPGEPELYASYDNVEKLRDQLGTVDAIPIAVGAGTLNDIVKRASGELDRPYMIVGTAASMDGYTAFGSSIAVDGFKQTLECPAPRACVADLDLMAQAPREMTASGYGDLLGKIPAGADWILADAVGVEPIDRAVWDQVQGPLRAALARPDAVAQADPEAIGELAEGLIMSGLAMQAHASSRPASGAEHQFSHLWEMEGLGVHTEPRRLSHGFKVGVGSVATSALYEELLAYDVTSLDIDAAVSSWRSKEELEEYVRLINPNPQLVDETVSQTLAKWIPAEELRVRLVALVAQWDDIARHLREQLLPAAQLQERLRAVGAPAHPSDIELDWDRFRATYTRAQTIRKRYTVLDVVFEAGIAEILIDRLFASDGFWGRQQP